MSGELIRGLIAARTARVRRAGGVRAKAGQGIAVTKITDPAGKVRTLSHDPPVRLVKGTEDPGTGTHLDEDTTCRYDPPQRIDPDEELFGHGAGRELRVLHVDNAEYRSVAVDGRVRPASRNRKLSSGRKCSAGKARPPPFDKIELCHLTLERRKQSSGAAGFSGRGSACGHCGGRWCRGCRGGCAGRLVDESQANIAAGSPGSVFQYLRLEAGVAPHGCGAAGSQRKNVFGCIQWLRLQGQCLENGPGVHVDPRAGDAPLKIYKPLLRVGVVFQSGLDLHFEQVAVDRAGDDRAIGGQHGEVKVCAVGLGAEPVRRESGIDGRFPKSASFRRGRTRPIMPWETSLRSTASLCGDRRLEPGFNVVWVS